MPLINEKPGTGLNIVAKNGKPAPKTRYGFDIPPRTIDHPTPKIPKKNAAPPKAGQRLKKKEKKSVTA
jgi:hypothetical protein